MPWVWSDDLARLLERDEDVPPPMLRQWCSTPIAYPVPVELDLRSFARSLVGLTADPSRAPMPECSCGRSSDVDGAVEGRGEDPVK